MTTAAAIIAAMRVLVTGGNGFIGSHLVEALLARGDTVSVLDDLSSGCAANLAPDPQLALHIGSVCDADAVARAIDGCDAVVHLAAAVGVRRILDERVHAIGVNLEGAARVLEAAARRRAVTLIASSSEVYGRSTAVPFREDAPCVLGHAHRWSYAGAKLMDEFLAFAHAHERGLPVTALRYFNVCGPRQAAAYGMVLPRFCAAARAGRALEVHGDGRQTRCFLHVADAVAATLALLGCDAARGQAVNIGSDDEVCILDLAQRVVAAAGTDAPIRLTPYAEAFPEGGFEDLPRRVPDLARIRALCGWQARHGLDAIIADVLAG
jgi:UDP-glucose 4-epimerase